MLFGAGASAFSGPVQYRSQLNTCPPLGSGDNGLFAAIQKEGGVAASLPTEIKAALMQDFESGMRLLEQMPYSLHCAFQRQIALHLASYRIRRHNLYCRLLAPPYMRSREIQYSTINYDMLLDQAFSTYGLQIEGGPRDSPNLQFITLLKLHGACNVLIKIENKIRGNEVFGAPFGLGSLVGGNPGQLYLGRSYREIESWCQASSNEQFAPVIAQFVQEKTFLSHANAFEALQRFWATKVLNAKVVVLIGVRFVPGDEHIWKPLFDSDAEMLIVDPNFDEIEAWGLSRARKPRRIAKYFSDLTIIQQAVYSGLQVIS